MPDPIRGRWTIYRCPCGATADEAYPERLIHRGNCLFNRYKAEAVAVVPVPDEAAIERAAEALRDLLGMRTLATDVARVVLAAALEQPE